MLLLSPTVGEGKRTLAAGVTPRGENRTELGARFAGAADSCDGTSKRNKRDHRVGGGVRHGPIRCSARGVKKWGRAAIAVICSRAGKVLLG